jgi:hypothetical protein
MLQLQCLYQHIMRRQDYAIITSGRRASKEVMQDHADHSVWLLHEPLDRGEPRCHVEMSYLHVGPHLSFSHWYDISV